MAETRVDSVVIGAGPNGLSAAITLAEAGRSVLVCEASDLPGGGVATRELTRPGFRHDVFSAVYPAGVASPVFERMPLAEHGLEWVQPPIAMAHPLPDGSAGALYPELERTVEQFEGFAPGDGRAWARFAGPYLDNFDAVRKTMVGGFPPIAGGLRLLAAFKLAGTLEFARLLLLPASALAEELFTSRQAQAWLYGSVQHGDVPPTEAGSGIAGFYLNMLGHAVGWPSPRGGADGLTNALVSYLGSLGGEIRTGSRVEQVLTRNGRVSGVGIAGGERVHAPLVVADVTPPQLLQLARPALPTAYTDKLARFRFGPATVKVDWALSAPVPWTASEARQAGTVHVGGDANEVSLAVAQVRAGTVPERPFVLFGQQSLADPTRAPEGCHTAWAYTRVPDGVDWSTQASGHVERMQAQIERFAPGFGEVILDRHVLSPQGLQDRNASLRGGDVGHGSYALDQLVFRPVPGLSPYRTPLRGLYLGSASAFPGGAVHGVPGWAAARQALWESRLRR